MKFVFLIVCLCLTACSTKNTTETNTTANTNFTPYIVNLKSERVRTSSEKEKCMSGVCLDGEFSFEGINDFEKKTSSDNDVYIKTLDNEEFPASFIIDCISKGKIPMLVIENHIVNIEDIAKKCSSLSPNIFISFDYGMDIEKYNQSAKIFRQYVPTASLMWNISYDEDIKKSPKEDYIDWINISFNEEISNESIGTNIEQLRNTIKYFSNKAVALNVSVENYAGYNHRYYTDLWKKEVAEIYSLSTDYENIALVSYKHNSDNNELHSSSRLSESRLIWQEYGNIVKVLPEERIWNTTDVVAYVNNDTAYIKNGDAILLNIEERYVNNNYAAIRNYSVDVDSRKMFVYSDKM